MCRNYTYFDYKYIILRIVFVLFVCKMGFKRFTFTSFLYLIVQNNKIFCIWSNAIVNIILPLVVQLMCEYNITILL